MACHNRADLLGILLIIPPLGVTGPQKSVNVPWKLVCTVYSVQCTFSVHNYNYKLKCYIEAVISIKHLLNDYTGNEKNLDVEYEAEDELIHFHNLFLLLVKATRTNTYYYTVCHTIISFAYQFISTLYVDVGFELDQW